MLTPTNQQLIQQLNRKIYLLDEYASTLQRQNLAKNNETATLYLQLDEIRNENDILRSHLSRVNQENIERMRRQQSLKEIQKINNSVNSSVELSLHQQHMRDDDKSPQRGHQQQQMMTTMIGVSCQTEFTQRQPQIDLSTIHQPCTLQIQKLLSTITQKDYRIQQLTKQSQQMYDTIIHLQEENQSLRKQLQQTQRQLHQTQKYFKQTQTKFKTQSKQMKSYQLEIEQLRTVLQEEREIMENQRREIQLQRDTNHLAEHQVDRLIRENNRLIERIRMLEKQKNTFYAQLRGKNVSPLKTSQISARQANIPTEKRSFINNSNAYSSQQKPQPQRFSSQFGIGKQKEKLKADRWRIIQDKLNRVKEENQQLKANLTIV